MALQTELSPPPQVAPGSGDDGPRSLRLLQPWASEAAPESGGRLWPDGPARWTRDRRQLALPSDLEVQAARPSAMLVMRQLLDAWRSADRQLAATGEGSAERSQVQAHVATLRSLYQGLFAYVQDGHAERTRV